MALAIKCKENRQPCWRRSDNRAAAFTVSANRGGQRAARSQRETTTDFEAMFPALSATVLVMV